MGVDLYRADFEARLDALQPRYDAAIAARDGGADVQGIVDLLWNEMYAHPYSFRDSYNRHYCLAWAELAYDDYLVDGEMSPETARRFAADIRQRSELAAFNLRALPDEHETDFDKRYYLRKLDRLIEFLTLAADADMTISGSY